MEKAYKHILTICFLLFIFVGMILNFSNIKNACISVIDDVKSLDIKTAVTNFESSINNNFANKMDIVDVNGAFKKVCGQKIANGTILGSNNQLLQGLGAALGSLEGYTFGMSTSIKTPDTVMLTSTWEATDKLRLSGLIRWANWSNFDELNIENEVPGALLKEFGAVAGQIGPALGVNLDSSMLTNVNVENDWQDTWLFSVGADYKINSAFTVRGGIAYETSPIDDQSTRMAVIPDTDRLWLSLGASWHATKDLQFDVGATYLMGVGDMDLYDDVGGEKVGKYDSLDAYLIGAQMQYRF